MDVGTLQYTMAYPAFGTTLVMVGADGAVAGRTTPEDAAGPVPTLLIAETAKRYWSPLVSPVTVHVVGTGVVLEMVTIVVPTVVHVWPPRLATVRSVAVTLYP